MTLDQIILSIQAFASGCMAGLIWFVQIVHYPLFARVGYDETVAYAESHQRRTTLVVAPLMLIELMVAVLLVIRPIDGIPVWLAWTGVAMVALLWLSTALIQVPQHAKLSKGANAIAVLILVRTNWARTVLWTVRALSSVWMLAVV